jgi:VanZ family protein
LKPSTRFFLLPLSWFILTTVLLILPGDKLPGPGFLNIYIPWLDKIVHIGLFSIMAALICLWLSKKGMPAGKKNQYFLLCGMVCVVYGILMELIQKFYVPNRSFDSADILADTVGSLVGVLFSARRYKMKAAKKT